MTPEERELISGLFERMRAMGAIDKDREAEGLIAQSARQVPDAVYMLVQSVLVQEHALQDAGARIEDLEEQLRDQERPQGRAAGGGGFLGGIFGGTREPEPEPRGAGSVPAIGSRRDPSGAGRGAFGASATERPGPFARAAEQPQRGGGSFLQGALTTAAGVAGGMLLANSIQGMLGSGSDGKAQASESSKETDASSGKDADNSSAQEPQYQDANDNDPGNDDSGSWGDSGDLDI